MSVQTQLAGQVGGGLHEPMMVPTVKLVSTMEDPSSGSNATEYPLPPCTNPTMFSSHYVQ